MLVDFGNRLSVVLVVQGTGHKHFARTESWGLMTLLLLSVDFEGVVFWAHTL